MHTLTSKKHFFMFFFTHWKGNPVVSYDQRDLRSSLALSNKELISFTYFSSSIGCSNKIMTKLHLRDCITHSLHFLFLEQLLMYKQAFLIIPRQTGFCKSLWWGTLSKSLLKSKYFYLLCLDFSGFIKKKQLQYKHSCNSIHEFKIQIFFVGREAERKAGGKVTLKEAFDKPDALQLLYLSKF